MATVTTNSQPVVGAYGDIFSAASGTAIPASFDAVDTDPLWTKLGMISEDGASWTPPEEETEDIKIWQSSYPARTVTTGLSSSLSFALDGWDRITVPFALGGGTFEDSGTTVVYHPPAPGESEVRALFLKVLDGPVKLGLYFAKGRVIGRDDAVFKPDEAALLNVEFGLLGDPTLDPYNLVFDQATFPAGVAATGATAGTPGTFTPPGADPPEDLAALTPGVTATPTTAWTTNQHVVLGDSSKAYWNGTAWATGQAALMGAEGGGEARNGNGAEARNGGGTK